MKSTQFSGIALILLFIVACSVKNISPDIRINQLGYLPNSLKTFVVVNTNATSFKIEKNGSTIYKGELIDKGLCAASGENVKTGNFSALTDTGTYYIYIDGKGISNSFKISPDLYSEVAAASLKAFYYQRCSMPIDSAYGKEYAREAGHPDTVCLFHPSTGKTGTKPSPWGWYDAGDYNKYVVNGGVTVATLLSLYEMFPNAVSDNTNIPESNNNISDLLDEVKYELDWMLTMQDNDGGVFHKLTNKNFDGFNKPNECKADRYFVSKGTAATLNFAASMAQASRIYKQVDKKLAETYLLAAEKAYKWAVKNPDVQFKNPQDVVTGQYGDADMSEEFFWAAAELFVSTSKIEYQKELNSRHIPFKYTEGENWRQFVGNFGYFSLISKASNLPEVEKEKIKKAILAEADSIQKIVQGNAYGINLSKYYWGSNSDVLDAAIVLAYAYSISEKNDYLNTIISLADYIFGENATGYSFVTGFGSHTPMHPHHRLSGSDSIANPIPGFLVGGPNENKEDKNDITYTYSEPARSYMDIQNSYASNEVAINWNAPLVFVTYFLSNIE
jgi:endoglucanase